MMNIDAEVYKWLDKKWPNKKIKYIDENDNVIENFKHRKKYMSSIGFNVLRKKQ